MNEPIRLIHLADLHLGCTMPANVLRRDDEPGAGRSVRETDLEHATRSMTSIIIAQQPPVDVVVVAGDLFHRAVPTPRAIDAATRMVRDLTRAKITVILADGNHDNTADRLKTGSPLSFLRHLGAIVINGPEAVTIGTAKPWANPRLQGQLAITAVPFEAVRQGRFAGVRPITGLLNVLVIHGRVGEGMPETNTLHGRTPVIPTEILRRGWDYVALGDWHEHKCQPVSGLPAYYAGSLEALTFREAAAHPTKDGDPWSTGGAIKVTLTPNAPAIVDSLPSPHRRPVLRLQPINATDMDAVALTDALTARLEGLPEEALATLTVEECAPQAWKEVDWSAIDPLRMCMRRCEIRPNLASHEDPELVAARLPLDAQWRDFLAGQNLSTEDLKLMATLGLARINTARDRAQAQNLEEGIITNTPAMEEHVSC